MYVLGASEVSANLYTVIHVHLYWEGCVIICGYLWCARYVWLYTSKAHTSKTDQAYISVGLTYV